MCTALLPVVCLTRCQGRTDAAPCRTSQHLCGFLIPSPPPDAALRSRLLFLKPQGARAFAPCAACRRGRTQPNTRGGQPPPSKRGAAGGGSIALRSCLLEWGSVKTKVDKSPLKAQETEKRYKETILKLPEAGFAGPASPVCSAAAAGWLRVTAALDWREIQARFLPLPQSCQVIWGSSLTSQRAAFRCLAHLDWSFFGWR